MASTKESLPSTKESLLSAKESLAFTNESLASTKELRSTKSLDLHIVTNLDKIRKLLVRLEVLL